MRHCFHESGVSKLVNPPQIEDVCCFCGKKRWRTETPMGHGEFFPKKHTLPGHCDESRPFDNEECPNRQENWK